MNESGRRFRDARSDASVGSKVTFARFLSSRPYDKQSTLLSNQLINLSNHFEIWKDAHTAE